MLDNDLFWFIISIPFSNDYYLFSIWIRLDLYYNGSLYKYQCVWFVLCGMLPMDPIQAHQTSRIQSNHLTKGIP